MHCPKLTSIIDRRGFLAVAGSVADGRVVLLAGVRASAVGVSAFKVGPVRRLGPDGAKYFEPWIAANPRGGSNQVVVGSRYLGEVATRMTERMEPAAWITVDGGATWSARELAGTDPLRRECAFFADSYATYAPDGTAFCIFLGSPDGDRLDSWVFRSDDGGRRWNGPTIWTSWFDYPRLAAELHEGKPRVFIAVAVDGNQPIFGPSKRSGYGCAVLRSNDGARTFSVVNFLASTTLQHDAIDSPVVLPEGHLLVGFADYAAVPSDKGPREPITHGRIYTASSRDGGATFSLPSPLQPMEISTWCGSIPETASGRCRRRRLEPRHRSSAMHGGGLEYPTSRMDFTPLPCQNAVSRITLNLRQSSRGCPILCNMHPLSSRGERENATRMKLRN